MEWSPDWGLEDDDDDAPPPRASIAAPASQPTSREESHWGVMSRSIPRYDRFPQASEPRQLPLVRMEKTTERDLGLKCIRPGCERRAWMKSVGLKKEFRHCDNGQHNAAVTEQFLDQVAEEGKLGDLKVRD